MGGRIKGGKGGVVKGRGGETWNVKRPGVGIESLMVNRYASND